VVSGEWLGRLASEAQRAPRTETEDSGNDWEEEGGGVVCVVEDGVGGRDPLLGSGGGFPGVQVAVEAGEIAAGDFQADAVAGAEDVARGP
jgi:hypothetical protein